MISNLKIDILDGRGLVPIQFTDGEAVLECFATRVVIQGTTDQVSSDLAQVTATVQVLGLAAGVSRTVQTEQSETDLKTFRLYTTVDPLSRRKVVLTDADGVTFTITLVWTVRRDIEGAAALSLEDGEIYLTVRTDSDVVGALVRATIHYQGFYDYVKVPVTPNGPVTRVFVTNVKEGMFHADCVLTLWSADGNRKTSKVKLFPSAGCDLRKYGASVEHSSHTQMVMNAFPEWAECRMRDTEYVLRFRNAQADNYPKNRVDEPVEPDSVLQVVMNAIVGSRLQEIQIACDRTTDSLITERFPLDELSSIYHVNRPTDVGQALVIRDSLLLVVDGETRTDHEAYYGTSVEWSYNSSGVHDFSANMAFDLSDGAAVVTMETQGGGWLKAEITATETTFTSSTGLSKKVTTNSLPSAIAVFFSLSTASIFCAGELFGPIRLGGPDARILLTKLSISSTGTTTRNLNVVSFDGFSSIDGVLVMDDGTTCIPVRNIEDLRLAPTTELRPVEQTDRPRSPRVKRDNLALYYDRVVVDRHGVKAPMFLGVQDDRLKMSYGPNGDVQSDCPVLLDGLSPMWIARDLCYQSDRCYILTRDWVLEVDPRTTNPHSPMAYVLCLSKIPNPHPEAQRINIDLEGRLWVS